MCTTPYRYTSLPSLVATVITTEHMSTSISMCACTDASIANAGASLLCCYVCLCVGPNTIAEDDRSTDRRTPHQNGREKPKGKPQGKKWPMQGLSRHATRAANMPRAMNVRSSSDEVSCAASRERFTNLKSSYLKFRSNGFEYRLQTAPPGAPTETH